MERLSPPDMPDWLAKEVPFTRYCVEIEGKRMHIMEAGEGRPVVMLHGNPTWGFLYRKVALALKGTPLRLIMPDLMGLGFSHKLQDAKDHTLANHGRWLRLLIEGLDLRDLIFVGQDWGGPIGLRALADCPERCAGIVVGNTSLGPPKAGFKGTSFHRFSQMPGVSTLIFRGLSFPQAYLNLAQGDRSIKGVAARAYRYPLRGWSNNIAPLALARMVPDAMEHPSVAQLAHCQSFIEAFEGPAAIVWGKRDPILGRLLRRSKKLLPQADVWETEAGHFLQEQAFDEMAMGILTVARKLGDDL